MVDKRFRRKMGNIRREIISPELTGGVDYEVLVIGWGSTYGTLREALDNLDDNRISFLHFKQIYPVHSDTLSFLENARKTIIFENNATAQFAHLIKLETGFDIDKKVLKYDGMPFSVEEVTETLEKFMGVL